MQGVDDRGEKLHTRSITIDTFATDRDEVLVEGRLTDTRYIRTHIISGEVREPGTVHDIVVRLWIGRFPPTILKVECDMCKTPLPECHRAAEACARLVDLSIVPGFSNEVRERLGSVDGCTHTMALVLAMGSATMQGYGSHLSRDPLPEGMKAILAQILKNNCLVWREDGETYRKLLKDIASKDST